MRDMQGGNLCVKHGSLKIKEVVFQWQDKNLQWTVTMLPVTFHTRSPK